MAANPFEWNVVVAGAWNLAILTPQGIAQRLFLLDPAVPVEVQIAINAMLPMRVVHDDLQVIPSSRRLQVQPTVLNLERMIAAASVATRALESLSQTPVNAAGVNFSYVFDTLPAVLVDANKSSLDDLIDTTDFNVQGRTLKRTLDWKDGVLNLDVAEDQNAAGTLHLNFHRASSDPAQLVQWLGEVATMHKIATALLTTTFGLTIETETHE